MRVLTAAVLTLLMAGAFMRPASAQRDVQMYECLAKVGVAGREEGSMSSPLIRWEDGRLRALEKRHSGFTSTPRGKPMAEWIELFGALRGHGSSFLGFFRSRHFECKTVEE